MLKNSEPACRKAEFKYRQRVKQYSPEHEPKSTIYSKLRDMHEQLRPNYDSTPERVKRLAKADTMYTSVVLANRPQGFDTDVHRGLASDQKPRKKQMEDDVFNNKNSAIMSSNY